MKDFGNYRACTVADANAVDPTLLKNEVQPDVKLTKAFGDNATSDEQIHAIVQMTQAHVHQQRIYFPITLGIILFCLWLIWAVCSALYKRLRGQNSERELRTIVMKPATSMLISPLAVILVLVSLVFPGLEV